MKKNKRKIEQDLIEPDISGASDGVIEIGEGGGCHHLLRESPAP